MTMSTAQQTVAASPSRRLARFPLAALATAAATALTLAACGGGGGADSTASSGTSANTATYSGTVSGLGSIVVNGVRFSTSGASTSSADDPSQPHTKPFGLGTTVSVTGTVNADGTTGTATAITVHGGVRGKVTAVDTANSTFTVDGQVIQVDSSTIYDGTTTGFGYATLVAGTTYVEAYGVLNATTGVLTATRVEEKTQLDVEAAGFAVRGLVSNLSTTDHTFDVTLRTGLVVHVNYVQDANVKPAASDLANGAGVRLVMDATNAQLLANATSTVSITVQKVLVKRESQGNGSTGVVRGAVDTISSDAKTWTINGVTVDVSSSTLTLTGLSSLSSVSVGTVVVVKGSFSNGVLTATQVISKVSDDNTQAAAGIKLYGITSGKTVATGATKGSFVVQGVTVTLLSDSSLSLPEDGTYVEVKASNNATYGAVATEIETRQASTIPRSFEVYGTTPCPTGTAADFTGSTGFALTLRSGSATVLGANATVSLGRNVSTSTTADDTQVCLVEVKGTLNTSATNTIDATKIEVKARGTTASSSVSLR
jgi:hypothetical protein